MTTREGRLWAAIFGLICLCALLLAMSVRADEFRAVVVTEREASNLRAAKAHADEAHAAFERLREATEAIYRERLGGAWTLDWSTDFRVVAERRWPHPSNLQWLDTQPLYRPGGWGSVTIPTTRPLPADVGGDTGVSWGLDIPGTLSTGPTKSPLVFK